METMIELKFLTTILDATVLIHIHVPSESDMTAREAARLFENLKDETRMATNEFLASREEEKDDVAFGE